MAAPVVLYDRIHFLNHQLTPLSQSEINDLVIDQQNPCKMCRYRELTVDGKPPRRALTNLPQNPYHTKECHEICVRLSCGCVYGKACVIWYFSVPDELGSYRHRCPYCSRPLFIKPPTHREREEQERRDEEAKIKWAFRKLVYVFGAAVVLLILAYLPGAMHRFSDVGQRNELCVPLERTALRGSIVLDQTLNSQTQPLELLVQGMSQYQTRLNNAFDTWQKIDSIKRANRPQRHIYTEATSDWLLNPCKYKGPDREEVWNAAHLFRNGLNAVAEALNKTAQLHRQKSHSILERYDGDLLVPIELMCAPAKRTSKQIRDEFWGDVIRFRNPLRAHDDSLDFEISNYEVKTAMCNLVQTTQHAVQNTTEAVDVVLKDLEGNLYWDNFAARLVQVEIMRPSDLWAFVDALKKFVSTPTPQPMLALAEGLGCVVDTKAVGNAKVEKMSRMKTLFIWARRCSGLEPNDEVEQPHVYTNLVLKPYQWEPPRLRNESWARKAVNWVSKKLRLYE
jgi:hypothetical protein